MKIQAILMAILLTGVSQICPAQLGTFGAPVSKEQMALAEANSKKIEIFLYFLKIANQIKLKRLDPCRAEHFNRPENIQLFIDGYSRILNSYDEKRLGPDYETLVVALKEFQRCSKLNLHGQ